MLGKSDYDLFPHEQAQIFTQKDRDVLQGKKFVDIEEESIQTRNKGERVLRTRKVPLLNEEGEPEYLLGISEDITGRKEAETRFRELFNHISSGVAVYEAIDNGRDFIFRDFNPAAEKIEKINKKDLLGKRVTEVFPGVKEFGVFNVFQRVWKTGKMEYYPENIYKEGKNQESWRENWVYKLSTGEVVAVYNDITGRKQAEEALIKNEEMYRLVVDNMADVIAIIDMNLRFTYISPSIVRLLGYTVEEATAKTLEQFMTPESLQIVTRVFEEELKLEASGTADPGRIRTLELEEYRKDGSTVWLENRLSSFRDKENKLAGIIVLSHDITDRKQAEETLKESEKKYRLLADNVDDVIFVLDMNLNYTYASPSVKILMGYEPEELLKLRASETMTPSSWDLATKNLSKELEKYEQGEINKLQVLQLEMRRKDGSIVWTEVKVSFIRDENRRPVGIICVSRDITERKLAEAKLLETLNSLKKAFGTTIQVMVSAIEARDPYTSGHQSRAADIAGAIATEMGLPKERVVGILMAGSIHDIGKLSVPAEILSKPAKLSDIEFSLIKEHSHSGYEILKNVESPWPLAQIVYQHHERMDGSGYPRNLKGEEILLDARIMAVADVVEAMASHRPYRSALGIDAALEEIEKNKGIIYDATVADACLKLFREKGYKMIAQK
jgi:PAS domain S-box-containing protein